MTSYISKYSRKCLMTIIRTLEDRNFHITLILIWILALFKFCIDIVYIYKHDPKLYIKKNFQDNSSTDLSIINFQQKYKNSIKFEISYGDLGNAVKLNDAEKEFSKNRFSENYFDVVVSDKIPLLRRLPEKRQSKCLYRKFPEKLPKFDVIITFYNEAFSTLLRTIHSVLSRSPPDLLNDIILIDDFSNETRSEQQRIVSEIHDLKKVKYHRLSENGGLIKARQKGAEFATMDVIIFLDSHSECFDGWVEPLLADIVEKPNNIITPVIVSIDNKNFSISKSIEDKIHVGTLTSRLAFNLIQNGKENDIGYKKK